jgi:glutathione S-transferase
MMTLYGMRSSGNCYKPRLLMAKLGIAFRNVDTGGLGSGTSTPEFLAKNPNGKVPLLELDDGRLLAESNAMLLYLAEGTRFVPAGGYERALVYQWLFFEQYSHEPYIAVLRAIRIFPERASQATPEHIASLLAGGHKALGVMESQLAKTLFIAGDTYSIADIALYAYTQDAGMAGFEMERFPNVVAWMARVVADPSHVPLDWVPESVTPSVPG